jgi:hypothetical protein
MISEPRRLAGHLGQRAKSKAGMFNALVEFEEVLLRVQGTVLAGNEAAAWIDQTRPVGNQRQSVEFANNREAHLEP